MRESLDNGPEKVSRRIDCACYPAPTSRMIAVFEPRKLHRIAKATGGNVSEIIWVLAIIIAIGAGFLGLLALFYLLGIAAKATARVAGISFGSLAVLVIQTVTDIRFLSLLVVIFTMLTSYERGGWIWISFSLSISLFLMSAAYITFFLLELVGKDIFERFEHAARSEDEKRFWSDLSQTVFLNVGFLGIFYIFFSFFAVSYNSVFAAAHANMLSPFIIFDYPRSGPLTYSDFMMFSLQTAVEVVPFDLAKKLGIRWTRIQVNDNAYIFNAFVFVFKCLFLSAIGSFIGGAIKRVR